MFFKKNFPKEKTKPLSIGLLKTRACDHEDIYWNSEMLKTTN